MDLDMVMSALKKSVGKRVRLVLEGVKVTSTGEDSIENTHLLQSREVVLVLSNVYLKGHQFAWIVGTLEGGKEVAIPFHADASVLVQYAWYAFDFECRIHVIEDPSMYVLWRNDICAVCKVSFGEMGRQQGEGSESHTHYPRGAAYDSDPYMMVIQSRISVENHLAGLQTL